MTAQVERAADTIGGAIYNLADTVYTEKDGVYSWTANLTLAGAPVAKVSWNGPKKTATVAPLAKTTGAADEVKRFEATAKRLLPGRDSVTDLIQVMVFTLRGRDHPVQPGRTHERHSRLGTDRVQPVPDRGCVT